jgi:DNA-binding transcriptional ArsR family regulator
LIFAATGRLQYDTRWFHIASVNKPPQPSIRVNRVRTEDRLDQLLHALSDRTRRTLLKRLSSGPAMVGELAQPFDMTRVAVSKHLRVLEKARLITRTIEGRRHRCELRAESLQEVERWLMGYRAFWTQKLDALAHYAEEGKQ